MGTRPTPAIDKNGIAWLAGEASGDYIASLVLPEVEKRFPGTPQYGVGGPRMRAENFHAWHDIRELSVRGYVEVLMHLPRLVQLGANSCAAFPSQAPVFLWALMHRTLISALSRNFAAAVFRPCIL